MTFKTFFQSIAFLLLTPAIYSQEISNLVLVGDSGITEDIKKAHSFIIIKSYPDNKFERLDYKFGKPLQKLRTYNDSMLTNLEGKYIEYTEEGNMLLSGNYENNQRQGSWYHYNDTGKVVLKDFYENGTIVWSENPDTVKKKESQTFPGEKEAAFKGGMRAWVSYVQRSTNPDIALQSVKGGKVRVLFVVDTKGKTKDVYLRKSVEFVLDEEALRVIRDSPLWEPAFQNGKNVNAYRVQPFTFLKE